MKTEDLFPPCYPGSCVVPSCKDKRKPHHHVLSTQQEFLSSAEKYVALVGGYGSAKTLATCVMGHLLSVSIPGNMGIVVRRSLPKLHDSTERIYLEVLKRSGVSYTSREMRDGWPHRIVYSNGSEVTFRETKDLGRFLGPEYGWFYIDEAQEEPQKTFTDLVGRLRLPRARKYLRGFLATNPPSQQHWIAKLWPKPGSYKRTVTLKNGRKVTNSYRMIQSSTYDNPFLSDSYIAGILENNSASEARRIIEGFYGFVQDGPPVYPTFDFMKHVADPKLFQMTLYRVWDWGFNCPACTWSQIFRCQKGSIHMNVLQELMGSKLESEAFADEVLALTKESFPEHPSFLLLDGADAAGAEVNERGPGPIIRLSKTRAEGGRDLRFRYRKFPNIDPGLDLIRKLLNKKCPCGFYLLTIHRRCRNLIEAMAGGYHYPKTKPDKDTQRKPVKDGFYDNITDPIRYTGELFYRPYEQGIDLGLEAAGETVAQTSDPWLNPFGMV